MENKYTLTIDKLQIYFPWDDDLYKYFKDHNLEKYLPLISAENTELDIEKKEAKRKNVILPELFGESFNKLGWTECLPKDNPIIPPEKPLLAISSENNLMNLEIISTVKGKEEYHLEHSHQGGGGVRNVNWAMVYLSFYDLFNIVQNLSSSIDEEIRLTDSLFEIKKEIKENTDEILYYIEIPVIYYEFSLGSFKHASIYLKNNSNVGEAIPSLIYDEILHHDTLNAIAKIGIIKNKQDSEFNLDSLKFVIKLAQTKETISKRGKRAKLRGILTQGKNKNLIVLDKDIFIIALMKLKSFVEEKKDSN